MRVDIDYDKEVHQSIKNFKPKTRFFEAMIGIVGQDGGKKKKEEEKKQKAKRWSSPDAKFLI